MKEFFEKLFSAGDFLPHGRSYFWRPDILWTHVLSDGLIAISYFVIPICLIVIARRRADIQYRWMLVLFGIFIYSCGVTHLMNIVTVWNPLYRLEGIFKVITALSSIGTAIALIKITPRALTIPTVKEWLEVNQELKEQGKQLEEKNEVIQHSEQALRESEERYKILREIFDSVVIQQDNQIVFANPAAAHLLGVADEQALTEKSIQDFIHPDYSTEINNQMGLLTKGEKMPVSEQRIIRPDGAEVDVELVSVPLTYHGQPAIQIIIRDISTRKKQEKILRESEAKFRGLFESDMIGTMFWELNGKVTDANDALLNMIGYSREDQQQNKIIWKTMTPPEYEYLDVLAWQEMAGKGSLTPFEKEYIRKDGSRIPVLIGASLLEGYTDRAVAFVLDITEQDRVRKELKQHAIDLQMLNAELEESQEVLRLSESRFRRMFESELIGIAFWDKDGNLIDVNNLFLQTIGYSREEWLNGEVNWVKMTPSEYTALDEAKLKEMDEHGVFTSYEKEYCRKDGTRVPILIGGARLEGFTDRGVSYILDITPLKQVQKELEERAKELVQSNQELEQFTYIASHDLQEPLRTMAGFANLLEKKYKNRLDQDANEFIEFIVDAAERMKKLIMNLLEYSRLNTKEAPFTAVDFEKAVNRVMYQLQNKIQEGGVEIFIGPLPLVQANEAQIVQLLQNLLGNAIKFRDERPLAITIEAEEKATHWQFAVKDTGIGINMTYATRIFQVFQRLHTRDKYEGTGIGLAICKKIVEKHKGDIWVESVPDVGSTFYFTIQK